MLKFDRQEFKDRIGVGESVDVKISDKWEDGSELARELSSVDVITFSHVAWIGPPI